MNKYGWVDTGSSFLPSEVIAASLWAQLENMDVIQNRRKAIRKRYYEGLKNLEIKGLVKLPNIPTYATNNAHMFYLVCHSLKERTELISFLKDNGILSVFHYLSLHLSEYYTSNNTDIPNLPECDHYADCLVRLPMYYELSDSDVDNIINLIIEKYDTTFGA